MAHHPYLLKETGHTRATAFTWAAVGRGLVYGTLWLLAILLAVLLGWLLGHLSLSQIVAWVAPGGQKAAWYLARASGVSAYLLLSGSTAWGLILSTKIVADRVPAPLALALHNALGWLAIAFAGFHAFVLLFDGYYAYRLLDLLVPFIGPYRPGWVGLGTLGLYGALLTSASFSLRKWIGQRRWRRLHYLTFAVYVLASLHGLMAGTDGGSCARAMYLGSVLLVLFLTNYRLLAAGKGHA